MDRPRRLVDSGCLGVVPAGRRRSRVIVSSVVVARARRPSDPERRKRIKRGQREAFRLTRQERDLIVERTFVDAEIESRLRHAISSGSDLIVDLTLDDVDELAGHVAAGANHCSQSRVRRVLDAVYDRLANIEDAFTDEGDEAADAVTHEVKAYTPKQGRYLAFIYYYTKIHSRAP